MRTTLLAFVGAIGTLAGTATATPLTLRYCASPNGDGTFKYRFTLTLDNNDGTWVPGHGFNWIIFGDSFTRPSPLEDFVGDLPAPKPFDAADEGFKLTGSFHYGPTLLDWGPEFDMTGWVPKAIGDSISWSGTASTFLGENELLWSNIFGTGTFADFEYATYLGTCECPPDFNGDGFVTGDDYDAYAEAFVAGDSPADFNHDGFVTGDDFDAYVLAFEAGC